MPKPQNSHPWEDRVYANGANRDLEKEFLSAESGTYVDANNMRTGSMDGDNAAIKKINGEEILHRNFDNRCNSTDKTAALPGSYKCIGVVEVNDRKVEFWVDKGKAQDSLIRIDGSVVLKSPDFPITVDNPLQIHKNESCVGGEIYITDFKNSPMIFNIEDLLKNNGEIGGVCTQKYFDDFNFVSYTLQLTQPADHPVFVETVNLGSGGGLPVGLYQYSIRYSTTAGDRTQFSVATPLIPIVSNESSASVQYPFIKTVGADPAPLSATNFGIKIRFRVANLNDFDFIEIRRTKFTAGTAIGVLPVVEILDIPASVANLINGEIAVREFTDGDPVTVKETVTDDEDTLVMNSIKRAKALRYFNNRLYLMNVEFDSRDLENTFTFLERNSEKMFQTIEQIGIDGHNDAYHFTNHRSYPGGEKFGFAIVGYDAGMERTFAQDVIGFDNFQFKNRREKISTNTLDTSYLGTSRAATVDGDVQQVHEVFDFGSGTTNTGINKTDLCTFKNILDAGSKSRSKVNSLGCDDPGFGSQVGGDEIRYQPYHPSTKTDTDVTGHNYRINHLAWEGSSFTAYNPKGFASTYYAQGMALTGLDKIPSYIQAFSVVRTEAAKRVFTQGIGFYKLNTAAGAFGANTSKETNKFVFFSPDVDKGLVTIQDVITNPDRFRLQLVSPLGVFSEVYDGDNLGTGSTRGIDMISYARMLRDKTGASAEINPTESATFGLPDGGSAFRYVGYGKWRKEGAASAVNSGPFKDAKNGNRSWLIKDVKTITEGRGTFYEIEVQSDTQNPYPGFYNHKTADGDQDFDEAGVRNWHEPVYIVNIIQEGKDASQQDIKEFFETGHYQKVDAIIGRSSGADEQSFQLTDERWEDCIPDIVDSTGTALVTTFATLNRFIFVEDESLVVQRWVDVTFKSTGDITTILNDITNNGFHTTSDGFKVVGIYVHENESNQNRFFKIKFGRDNINDENGISVATLDTFADALFIPPDATLIKVKYDNRIPIRFFGGDTTVGEAIFSPLDKEYAKDGKPKSGEEFKLNIGLPFKGYEINPRVYIINNTTAVINKIQDDNTIMFDASVIFPNLQPSLFRQLAVMFTVESKISMPFAFFNSNPGGFFPLLGYIQRPHEWDDSPLTATNNNIHDTDYNDDYSESADAELTRWGFGGFRFAPLHNIDYAKEPTFRVHVSKPKVGFTEQNLFCTRIVWSIQRPINVQDSPGVRTFPSANFFDISDNTGEIKFAWDANAGGGGDLYALTENGTCLLLVDKRIIHEVSGNFLASAGVDGVEGILKQSWISKDIGMNDEMWRSAAEWNESLYFVNKNSVYHFRNNQYEDILRNKYFSRVNKDVLTVIRDGFLDDLTGVYDRLHNEYWFNFVSQPKQIEIIKVSTPLKDYDTGDKIVLIKDSSLTSPPGTFFVWLLNLNAPSLIIKNGFPPGSETITLRNKNGSVIIVLNPGEVVSLVLVGILYVSTLITEDLVTITNTYAYSEIKKHWMGAYDYKFDRFLALDNKMFGMRDLETFELNKGLIINNDNIDAFVLQASAPSQREGKEFIRQRVNSDVKPTGIDYFNNFSQFESNDVQSFLDTVTNPDHLLDYDGFVGYIPRKTAAPNDRMQGRVLLYKIKHNKQEPFKIVSTAIQYKVLQ